MSNLTETQIIHQLETGSKPPLTLTQFGTMPKLATLMAHGHLPEITVTDAGIFIVSSARISPDVIIGRGIPVPVRYFVFDDEGYIREPSRTSDMFQVQPKDYIMRIEFQRPLDGGSYDITYATRADRIVLVDVDMGNNRQLTPKFTIRSVGERMLDDMEHQLDITKRYIDMHVKTIR